MSWSYLRQGRSLSACGGMVRRNRGQEAEGRRDGGRWQSDRCPGHTCSLSACGMVGEKQVLHVFKEQVRGLVGGGGQVDVLIIPLPGPFLVSLWGGQGTETLLQAQRQEGWWKVAVTLIT